MPDEQVVARFAPAGKIFSKLDVVGTARVVEAVENTAVVGRNLYLDVG